MTIYLALENVGHILVFFFIFSNKIHRCNPFSLYLQIRFLINMLVINLDITPHVDLILSHVQLIEN